MSASDCLACSGGWPPTDQRVLDCGSSVAYLNEDQFFPGATILVLERPPSRAPHDPRRLGPSEREARIARIAAELR